MTGAGGREVVTSVEALDVWARTSRAGAEAIYAEAELNVLPRNALTARARALYDLGQVTLKSAREPGRWYWIAERLAGAKLPCERTQRQAQAAREDESPEALVMRLLRRAANLNRPCPTNLEIAKACSFDGADRASYIVKKLREDGKIRVELGGIGERRVVTIAASGRFTARGVL